MERAGCAGGEQPRRSRSWTKGQPEASLRGAWAVSLVSSRPGGVGLRPGTLRSPVRSWLTLVVGPSPDRCSPWNGQIPFTGAKGANPRPAKSAARRREPAPIVRAKTPTRDPGQTPRWSAGRRAGPVMVGHLRAGLSGDGLYREAGHGGARTTRTSVSLRSISHRVFPG